MTSRKYEPLAKELITYLSGFKEDEENFFRCEQYVLSNLLYHHCLDVNSHAVRRSIDGLILKFSVHGQHNRAENLRKLTQQFLKSPFFKDHIVLDIQWSLLSLLLHLSNNPTKFLQGSPQDDPNKSIELDLASSYIVQEDEVKEDFDWGAYLKEDNDELPIRKDDSLSDWSGDDEEEGNAIGPMPISRTQSDVSHCTLQLPALRGGGSSLKIEPAPEGTSTVATVTKESSHRARSWLEANLQPQFWCGKESGVTSTQFNKDAAIVAKLWEEHQKHIGIDAPSSKLISEWVVMREILWVLMYPAESFLFVKDDNGVFVIRSNITIPSIVQDAFKSYLSTMIPTLQKLEEINKFIKRTKHEIYNFPSTYLSYAQGLCLWRQKFLEHLGKLEKDLKGQEKTCTLLWLSKELKPWMDTVAVIYAAHMEGLSVPDAAPNWTKATWLLRALFEQLSSAGDMKSQTVLLRLFLHSLRYYLSIIHNWQYNGDFQDKKDEFVVKRNKDVSVGDESYWKSAYIIKNMESSSGSSSDSYQHSRKTVVPFLVPILKSLVVVGKSRELMASLTSHKVSKDGIVENSPKADDRVSLEQQFVENIRKQLAETPDAMEEQSGDQVEVIKNEASAQDKIVCEVQDHLQSLALQLNDPYLLEAFPSTFHCLDKATEGATCDNMSRTIEGLYICRGLSMERIFSLALHPLIQEEEQISSSQLLRLLFTEYKLIDHLQLLRGILLMEEGDVMHEFYSHLFVKLESGDIIDSLGMTLHLQDCISRRYPNFAQSFSVSVQQNTDVEEDSLEQKNAAPQEVPDSDEDHEAAWDEEDSEILTKKMNWTEKILDDITIHYSVPWPITLVLTKEAMEKYNKLFLFCLALKQATNCLERLQFKELSSWQGIIEDRELTVEYNDGSSSDESPPLCPPKPAEKENTSSDKTCPLAWKLQRLHMLRSWLLYLSHTLHDHFSISVLMAHNYVMCEVLDKAQDLDFIITEHEKYLQKLSMYCMLSNNKINSVLRKVLHSVFQQVHYLQKVWHGGAGKLTNQELVEMEDKYTACHRFLSNFFKHLTKQQYIPLIEGLALALENSCPVKLKNSSIITSVVK